MAKTSATFDTISSMAKAACLNEDYSYTYSLILAGIIDENHDIDDFDSDAIVEALEEIASKYTDDFYFEFDGNEYRCIAEGSIWDIYVDEIKQTVEDCYDLKLDSIPSFISFSIDWEETAQNAYADGYGHQFSSYDGSEIEICNAAGLFYRVFRTN